MGGPRTQCVQQGWAHLQAWKGAPPWPAAAGLPPTRCCCSCHWRADGGEPHPVRPWTPLPPQGREEWRKLYPLLSFLYT